MPIRNRAIVNYVASLALVGGITSCGGSPPISSNAVSSSGAASNAVTIVINPTSAKVVVGQTEQFTAIVTGSSDTAVNWSVNGVAGGNQTLGTITQAGLYTAPQVLPSPSGMVVTATSQAAPSASASANVTLSSGIALTIFPQESVLQSGQTQQFIVNVSGPSDSGVTWSVSGIPGGNASVGTMQTTGTASRLINGLYTAPTVVPAAGLVTITAISTVDPGAFVSARVTIVRDTQLMQNFPIKLGTSGGNASDYVISNNTISCCSGTLGSLVSRSGKLYILSNNHVLDKSDQGQLSDPISQPGLGDANCLPQNADTVAHMSEAARLVNPGSVDAAIAEIVPGAVDTSGAILDLNAPNQAAAPSATTADPNTVLSSNETVAKVGRSSGLTCSTLTSINTDLIVNYATSCTGGSPFRLVFTNQIVVSASDFSSFGDSGSLIVTADTARPVGLLFAGTGSQTAANPIGDVLSAFPDPSTGEVLQVIGAGDHPIACPAAVQSETAINPEGRFVPQVDSRLSAHASLVRTAHQAELMRDPAVAFVDIGVSEDNPAEPALVLHLSSTPTMPAPVQIEGVRTKLVFDFTARPPAKLAGSDIQRVAQVRAQHSTELMSRAAIFGVGIGASKDSAGEAALVIYLDRGASVPIPAEIDGTRTRVVRTDHFTTSVWGSSGKGPRSCSKSSLVVP